MGPLDSIDFETRFPHRFWFSNWTVDEDHPEGVRYKLVSSRGSTGPIELLVITENRQGVSTVVDRTEISPGGFDKTAAVYVDGLSDSLKLMFFAIDLTKCQGPRDLDRILGDAGWDAPPK